FEFAMRSSFAAPSATPEYLGNTTVIRNIRWVLTLVALVLSQIPFARAAEQVDLLLVLAMDVSRSMDQAKFELQRQGYAAAISNPQVLHAIESGPHQKIAICFIDWSAPFEQKLVIDWSIIDGPRRSPAIVLQ